jgi:hypothetical protein
VTTGHLTVQRECDRPVDHVEIESGHAVLVVEPAARKPPQENRSHDPKQAETTADF